MAKVDVFFSFEFDTDKELRGSFFKQSKRESRHAIRDYSLDKVHPPADWKEDAEKRIAWNDSLKKDFRFNPRTRITVVSMVPVKSCRGNGTK